MRPQYESMAHEAHVKKEERMAKKKRKNLNVNYLIMQKTLLALKLL